MADKSLAPKHTGVPIPYLMLAVMAYIAFAVGILTLIALAIKNSKIPGAPHEGAYIIGAVTGTVIISVLTGKYFKAFQASDGIPKPLYESCKKNISILLSSDDLKDNLKEEKSSLRDWGLPTAELEPGSKLFLVTTRRLMIWDWLFKGDTGGTYDGIPMRRFIPVVTNTLTSNQKIMVTEVSGKEIYITNDFYRAVLVPTKKSKMVNARPPAKTRENNSVHASTPAS